LYVSSVYKYAQDTRGSSLHAPVSGVLREISAQRQMYLEMRYNNMASCALSSNRFSGGD
jgi:hypothetical protein